MTDVEIKEMADVEFYDYCLKIVISLLSSYGDQIRELNLLGLLDRAKEVQAERDRLDAFRFVVADRLVVAKRLAVGSSFVGFDKENKAPTQ